MAWDGSSWSPLGSLGMTVAAFTIHDGRLVAGGAFQPSPSAARVAAWNDTAWSQVGDWLPVDVSAVTSYRRLLVVAGKTKLVEDDNAMAVWDGYSWYPLGGISERNPGPVNVLAVYNDQVIVGGRFDYAGGAIVHGVAAWFNDFWHPLGTGMGPISTYNVMALGQYSGQLIVGGVFSRAGALMTRGIAAWNGTSWSAFGSGIDGIVNAVAAYDGYLIAAGEFTSAGGGPAANIAVWSE